MPEIILKRQMAKVQAQAREVIRENRKVLDALAGM